MKSSLNKKYTISLVTLFLTGLVGCSNPLGDIKSYVDPNFGQWTPSKLPSPSGYEAVSGSKLMQTTLYGHKVDTTVGVATSLMKTKTAKNRTAYISVQGQIVSN